MIAIARLKRLLGRLRLGLGPRPGRRPAPARPLVSVVIPTYDVAPYLRDCLDSVLGSSLREIEVVVVDDGSHDDTAAIADGYAAADPRLRVLRQDNAGQGAARNRGVAQTTGEFLIFVDGDDLLPRHALRDLAALLQRTGSDFVLGPALRLRVNGSTAPPVWNASVFEVERLQTTIEDFPRAMFDVLACNRMFRRAFWVEQVGGFRGGIAYEDHTPMVKAFLAARCFDVVTTPIYHWRVRADGSSTRQQKHRRSNLADRIEVLDDALALITEAAPPVRAAWLGRVLDLDLAAFLVPALQADADYRAELARALARFMALADAAALRHVRVQQKVYAWLAAGGDWAGVAAAVDLIRGFGGQLPTSARDGEVVVAEGVLDGVAADLPAAVTVLGPYETAPAVCVRDIAIAPAGGVVVAGWALIRLLGTDRPVVSAELLEVGAATGSDPARVPVPVESRADPDATRWSRQRQALADESGFAIVLDPDLLTGLAAAGERRWQLRFEVQQSGVVRRAAARHALRHSQAGRSRLEPLGIGGVQIRPAWQEEFGLTFDIGHARPDTEVPAGAVGPRGDDRPRVVDVSVPADGEEIDIVVEFDPSEAADPAQVAASLRLATGRTTVGASRAIAETAATPGENRRFRLHFPLVDAVAGWAAPLGTYYLVRGERERLRVDAELTGLPRDLWSAGHRISWGLTAGGSSRIVLRPRLRPDEIGDYAQQRLREEFGTVAHDLDPGVLFVGVSGSGVQHVPRRGLAALAEQVAGEGLPVSWEQRDPADPTPSGVRAVISGSREWYAGLASSAVVCVLTPPAWWPADPTGRQQRVQIVAADDDPGDPGVDRGDADGWTARLRADDAALGRLLTKGASA